MCPGTGKPVSASRSWAVASCSAVKSGANSERRAIASTVRSSRLNSHNRENPSLTSPFLEQAPASGEGSRFGDHLDHEGRVVPQPLALTSSIAEGIAKCFFQISVMDRLLSFDFSPRQSCGGPAGSVFRTP